MIVGVIGVIGRLKRRELEVREWYKKYFEGGVVFTGIDMGAGWQACLAAEEVGADYVVIYPWKIRKKDKSDDEIEICDNAKKIIELSNKESDDGIWDMYNWIVRNSDMIVGVWDGVDVDVFEALKLASTLGKKVKVFNI